MKPRFMQNRIQQLFEYFPIVALTGARQVGKSTLLNHVMPSVRPGIVFDPLQDIQGARSDPDLFLQNITTPAFLDEVQYVPELLPALKRYVDVRQGQKSLFLLSGSQNLSVMKNLADSMAGRVGVVDLYGLSFRESENMPAEGILEEWLQQGQHSFTKWVSTKTPATYRAIWRGGMPGILEFPDAMIADYFSAYLRTYVERDIRSIMDIQDLSKFTRFVRLLAALSAQEINGNQLGRELDIDRTTALRWMDLCQSTYQWKQIPAFSRNPIKGISSKQKGYFTDTGFLCALQGIFSPEVLAGHPLQGHAFESFVVMEVIKRTECWLQRPLLYHYRSHGGAEVDLLLDYNGMLYPLEIKLTSHPGKKDAQSICSLRETFPNERFGPGLIACCAPQAYAISEDVWAIPWWLL